MSGAEQVGETAQVVLGQVGEHVEPERCRGCGKSADACGRSWSFCCPTCAGEPGVAGTSFLTHNPTRSEDGAADER